MSPTLFVLNTHFKKLVQKMVQVKKQKLDHQKEKSAALQALQNILDYLQISPDDYAKWYSYFHKLSIDLKKV